MRKERREIIILSVIAFLILLVIPISRQVMHGNLPIGEQAYGELIKAQNPTNIYYMLLNIFNTSATQYLFAVLGVASFIIFYSLMKGFEPRKRLLTSLLLITAPAFIYTFSTINIHAFSVFLFLVAVKLMKKSKVFAFLIMLIIATLSFFGALLALVLTFIYFFTEKNRKSLIALLIFFFLILLRYLFFNPEKIIFSSSNVLKQMLSSMGAISGYSLFFVLLAVIGFIALWKKKNFAYLALLYLLITFVFFGTAANAYLVFALSLFAGEGLFIILRRRWVVRLIKNLSIAIIAVGIMFSTSTYCSRLADAEPNQEIVKSLEILDEELDDKLVLSHCSNSYWISYFSGKKPFIDDCSEKKKIETAEKIFYSTDLADARSILAENNIGFVWIDPEMKQGQIWAAPQQGLLFLFRNNKTFKNLYRSSGIETWQVLE